MLGESIIEILNHKSKFCGLVSPYMYSAVVFRVFLYSI